MTTLSCPLEYKGSCHVAKIDIAAHVVVVITGKRLPPEEDFKEIYHTTNKVSVVATTRGKRVIVQHCKEEDFSTDFVSAASRGGGGGGVFSQLKLLTRRSRH